MGVSFILDQNNMVLLGKRSDNKDFGGGYWEFPSGRLDQGESIIEGIIREGREELDITLTPVQLIDAYSFKRLNLDIVLLNYYCTFEGTIEMSDEHTEIQWLNKVEAMEKFTFENQKNTLLNYFKLKEKGLFT
ncbi:MAG: NUDIX domain-containing protein [Candidatus Heimdallarchaeota archaeon]|nr:NUDIX domain-containing protein [Candidatus Heimdallarchaeota archaeon]